MRAEHPYLSTSEMDVIYYTHQPYINRTISRNVKHMYWIYFVHTNVSRRKLTIFPPKFEWERRRYMKREYIGLMVDGLSRKIVFSL